MANIRQVADEAGVSIGTVSRVLNNKPGVGEHTRQRVSAIAERLGYTPTKRSPSSNGQVIHLGFLSPHSFNIASNPFYAKVFDGVEHICRELQINLTYNSIHFTNTQLESYPVLVKDNHVDGLLLVSGSIPQEIITSLVSPTSLPVVLVDNYFPECPWDTVMANNVRGFRQSAEHLIKQGHRHIALMGGPDHTSIAERRSSYNETMRQHNLTPTIVTSPHLSTTDGQWGVVEILRQWPETTAIMCSNDQQAVGALQKLHELGYRVPNDFSLIGFDDINMAQFTSPPLTTVSVDRITMGQMAVQLLLDRIKSPERPTIRVTIGVELVERGSVSGPRTHTIKFDN